MVHMVDREERGGVRSYPTPPLVLVGLTNRAQELPGRVALAGQGKIGIRGRSWAVSWF